MTLEQKVKQYFERFKEAVEVFVAGEEELLFHKRGPAESYGQGTFKTITREEVETPAPSIPELKPEPEPESEPESQTTKK